MGGLRQHFTATEQLVVAFGYPRDEKDFFVVHDLTMRPAVECQLPDGQVVPAVPSSKPSATH